MSKLAKVVIVGRTNVGKSTLFNRLSVNVKSLTLDYEGVTRDFIQDVVCWKDRCFELVDSGGISLHKSQDLLAEKVRNIALGLLETADLIVFVCDGKAGLVSEDQEIGKFLHKLQKKVLVGINKADSQQAQEHKYEFAKLGFPQTFFLSAQHGTGINDLLDAIIEALPQQIQREEEEPSYKVVLLGKPNVGKSSLMNLLVEQERSLVTDIPGTTREAITEPIRFYQETITVTDTPGIRRKRAVGEQLEQMMVKTSFRALDNADIVLLLVDGDEATLSDQELKLAFYAFEQGKALILLINKADLVNEQKKADLERSFERYSFFLRKIPTLFISCKSQKNIGKILPLVKEVWQRFNHRFSDQELHMLLKEALQKTPLYHSTVPLYLKKVSQIKTAPITLLLYVNVPSWFGASQLAFFENIIRDTYNLTGVPLVFITRKS